MFNLALEPYLKSVPPKYMIKMSGYLQTLNQEVLYNLHRYQSFYGTENTGMMMLEYLLNTLPIPEMCSEPDQFKRYNTYLKPILQDLGRNIDPVQHRTGDYGSFLGPAARDCKQYIIPVQSESPLVYMPIGLSWPAWQRFRPFRVAVMQSKELTFHSYEDALLFRKDQPQLAVFTLDIAALAMMYSVYLNTLDTVPDSVLPNFLHRYVVFPALLEDSVNLWIRDQYIECLSRSINPESSHSDTAWVTANNGRIGSQYPQFVADVYTLITLGQSMSITPNTILSSLLMLHGVSITDGYAAFRRMNQVPQLRQYRWIDYLLQERWIDLVLRVVCLNKSWSEFRHTTAYLRRDIGLFRESHPWTDSPDSYTQAYINNSLDDKIALLDTTTSLT